VPVSNADVRVRGFRINTDLADESQSRGAPDPIRDAALAANALDVEIFDAGGSSGSTSGDAVAFVPNSPGSSVLTRANVVSRPDVSPSLTYRMASLPVLPIQEAHVTKYRVMALLYGPGANDFYGLAFADRGWEPSFSAGTAFVNDRGIVYLNVTSVNTNYDLRPMEAGFDLRVVLRINVPDLQINETETFDLKEGLRESKTFTLTADRPADVRVEFIGTTGDTISDTFGLTMRFVEPPPKRNFVDRIPGFEAVALIAVLGALAWRSYLRRS
jgi:hypothetical protein